MSALVGHLLLVLVGLALLVLGADVAVGAARRVARRMGVSELIVGLTVTSIGTSLPELATSATAAVKAQGAAGTEAGGVALGNLLGSNLFLATALLGLSGILRTLVVDVRPLRRDGAVLGIALLGTLVAFWNGTVERWEGGLLVGLYVVYLIVLVRDRASAVEGESTAEDDAPDLGARGLGLLPMPAWGRDAAGIALGLTLVFLGAQLAVDRGVEAAGLLGVSAALIGVYVGIGTSLPELVVTLQAARQGSSAISVGNLVGSSITNLLLCLGVAAVVAPIPVPTSALAFDLPFVLAGTVAAFALMIEHRDLTRAEGIALMSFFVLYLFLRSSLPLEDLDALAMAGG